MFFNRKLRSILLSPQIVIIIVIIAIVILAADFSPAASTVWADVVTEDEARTADFVRWYLAHQNTGGTYTLTGDTILDSNKYGGLSLPFFMETQSGSHITIDTGSYSLIVSRNISIGFGITIKGRGGQRGVIRVENLRSGKTYLTLSGAEVIAEEGIAIYVAEDAYDFNIVSDDKTAAFTVIRASGSGAVCIKSMMQSPLRVIKADIEATGNGAVSIESAGDVYLTYSKVLSTGPDGIAQANCYSIRTSGTVCVEGSQVSPAVSQSSSTTINNGIVLDTMLLNIEPVTVMRGTAFDDLKLPEWAKLCHDYGIPRITVKIIWDEESYVRHSETGTDFELTGTFNFDIEKEAVRIDESLIAKVSISFKSFGLVPETPDDGVAEEEWGGSHDDDKDDDDDNDDFSGTRGGGGTLAAPEREEGDHDESNPDSNLSSVKVWSVATETNKADTNTDASMAEPPLAAEADENTADPDTEEQPDAKLLESGAVADLPEISDESDLEGTDTIIVDSSQAAEEDIDAVKSKGEVKTPESPNNSSAEVLSADEPDKGIRGTAAPAILVIVIFACILVALNPQILKKHPKI